MVAAAVAEVLSSQKKQDKMLAQVGWGAAAAKSRACMGHAPKRGSDQGLRGSHHGIMGFHGVEVL